MTRPPGCSVGPIRNGAPERLAFTEETSNFVAAGDCAPAAVGVCAPSACAVSMTPATRLSSATHLSMCFLTPILRFRHAASRCLADTMILPAARASVGRGRFHAVDDQDLNGRAAWLEPKPELLLDGGEQRRDVIVCRWLRRAWRQP